MAQGVQRETLDVSLQVASAVTPPRTLGATNSGGSAFWDASIWVGDLRRTLAGP